MTKPGVIRQLIRDMSIANPLGSTADPRRTAQAWQRCRADHLMLRLSRRLRPVGGCRCFNALQIRSQGFIAARRCRKEIATRTAYPTANPTAKDIGHILANPTAIPPPPSGLVAYRVAAAQAFRRRRRHQPRRPPLAKISPGRPAPAMGPGTPTGSE